MDVDLIALSLLRIGFDTRAPRLFRETLWSAAVSGHADSGELLHALAEILQIGPADRPTRVAHARKNAALAADVARSSGFGFLSVLDPAYPHELRHIPDPPLGLWVRGSLSVLETRPAVAIVGSRNATPGGIVMARSLARGLADEGFVVTSGLARGIDEAAHRGALDATAPTIAVLGSGVDHIYPREHVPLARSIAVNGAVVAELPPGSRPLPGHFPLRNRIISGLSRAVVVVEASDKSGSLITAKAALDQGRDVLAVPGPVVSGCHQGCHALIKDGARLVETVKDVLDQLGWRPKSPQAGAADEAQKARARGQLWAMMRAREPVGLDELSTRSGRDAPELLAELSRLELAGHVTRVPGGRFVKVD